MSLLDQTVMITGASRGLGEALAHAFAAAGARLSLCARGEDSLRAVAEAVRATGAMCLARGVDVTEEGEVAAWVAATVSELGAPSVLVNNASVLGPRSPLADHSPDEWRDTLEVNLTGTFLVTRAVLPLMIAEGRGSVINVSSGAAVLPRTNWGAYSVSKHALEGLSTNLAAELAGSGVRVNVVDPGSMRTPMRAAAYPAEDPSTVKRPADATQVFLWLAGRESAAVTGQRFRADDF